MEQFLDKTFNDIITISKNINDLYLQLSKARYTNDKKEYEKTLQYIKLTTEYENKLYNSIDWKKELQKYPLIFNHFNYLLRKSNIPKEIQALISVRFQNSITCLLIRNPFLSNHPNLLKRQAENNSSILFQANRDITISTLYYLDKDIKKEQNKKAKKDLINFYYEIIFKQKVAEEFLDTPPANIEASGKERCILFNQNEASVNQIYQTMIEDTINTAKNIILNYTDEFMENYPKYISGQKFYLSLLKAAISQTSLEQQEKIEFSIRTISKEESQKSYNDLLSAITEVKSTTNQDNQQKKKSINKQN